MARETRETHENPRSPFACLACFAGKRFSFLIAGCGFAELLLCDRRFVDPIRPGCLTYPDNSVYINRSGRKYPRAGSFIRGLVFRIPLSRKLFSINLAMRK